MKSDVRLSMVLHALLHMADLDAAITSEALADRMGVHPVVMRRAMAGLREAGLVQTQRGHGGGFAIARKLEDIRLDEVYAALGIETIFRVGPRTEEPTCLVEREVNRTVDHALAEAQKVFVSRLRGVSVADIRRAVADVMPRSCHAERVGPKKGSRHHV